MILPLAPAPSRSSSLPPGEPLEDAARKCHVDGYGTAKDTTVRAIELVGRRLG